MYIASCLYPLQRTGSIIIVQTPICFCQINWYMPLVEPLLIKKRFIKREFPDSSYIIKCWFSISDVNALRL